MSEHPDVVEAVAALEHEQWAHWTRYMLEHLTPENIERWRRQCETPYDALPEREKESDRDWARRPLAAADQARCDSSPSEERHWLGMLYAEARNLMRHKRRLSSDTYEASVSNINAMLVPLGMLHELWHGKPPPPDAGTGEDDGRAG